MKNMNNIEFQYLKSTFKELNKDDTVVFPTPINPIKKNKELL